MTVSLGPVVGKVGGGTEIHRIDVPNYSTGEANKTLASLPIPADSKAVICFSARQVTSMGSQSANYPSVRVNESDIVIFQSRDSGTLTGAIIERTGPVEISHIRRSAIAAYATDVDNFVIYWWLVK